MGDWLQEYEPIKWEAGSPNWDLIVAALTAADAVVLGWQKRECDLRDDLYPEERRLVVAMSQLGESKR